MSNRRRLQRQDCAGGHEYGPSSVHLFGSCRRCGKPRETPHPSQLEEWRGDRESHELVMMSVEPDEPTDPTPARIDTPGPEVRHPWWWIFVVGAALGFVALVLCGCVAWIVEALT